MLKLGKKNECSSFYHEILVHLSNSIINNSKRFESDDINLKDLTSSSIVIIVK